MLVGTDKVGLDQAVRLSSYETDGEWGEKGTYAISTLSYDNALVYRVEIYLTEQDSQNIRNLEGIDSSDDFNVILSDYVHIEADWALNTISSGALMTSIAIYFPDRGLPPRSFFGVRFPSV